jgi:triacylglycerol lipase
MKTLALAAAVAASPMAGEARPAPVTILVDGIWSHGFRMTYYGEKRLQGRTGRVVVFDYDNSGRVSQRELGRRLADFIRKQNAPVNVIGFSMGGVVIRSALLDQPHLPVKRAVFLNSPHHGSLLAPAMGFLPGVRDLIPNSPLLRELAAAPWQTPTLCVWCPGDLMVIPGSSARWNRAAEEIRCDVPAHIWPLVSQRITDQVVAFLNGR